MLDSHSYSPLTGLSGGERIIIRGGKTRRFDVPVRMFPFTELRGWLEQAGFENVRGYGRDGEPLTINHPRMVVVAPILDASRPRSLSCFRQNTTATRTVILVRMPAPSDRPNRLFIVSEVPALLAGMAFPTAHTDWVELHRRGFQQLVRLHPGHYDPAPLTAHEILLEDLVGGRKPLDAASERDRVFDAARLATGCVQRGEGVVVHCLGGTGRTGTVLGCALRYLARDADEAVAMIQAHRPHWPESPWQEEVVRTVQLS